MFGHAIMDFTQNLRRQQQNQPTTKKDKREKSNNNNDKSPTREPSLLWRFSQRSGHTGLDELKV
jgi:hypothetical protein